MIATALIVEDQADSRVWLTESVQQAFPGVEVRAARTLAEARALLLEAAPELALVDLNLPDGAGRDFIAELAARARDCLTVVATIYQDDFHLFPALRAGAKGYLLKHQPRAQIVSALQRMADGEPPLSPAIARRLLEMFAPSEASREEETLSPREREVIALIAKGYKLAEAAKALGITTRTAGGYLKTAYRKLGVNSRAEAALEAARLGLVRPHAG